MATHWVREVRLQAASPRSGMSFFSKMLCWWMYNVLGYTNFAQSVTSGTYDPTGSATGTNGALSNANFNLVDSTYGAFAGGDVGKWVLIKDLTNPINSGWYKIIAYVDVNTVTIDFRTGATEYPTTASSLSWWMIPEDGSVPDTLGDYWRLRTPHADGWEIEVLLEANCYLRIRMSLNADWTATGKILQLPTPEYKRFGHNVTSYANNTYFYVEGTTEGTRLNFWFFTNQSPSNNCAISVAKLVPYETAPAHSASELWVLAGLGNAPTLGQVFTRGGNAGYWHGFVWRDGRGRAYSCYPLEWGYSDATQGFTQWASNEANARTGKNDLKPGTQFIVDRDNSDNLYEVLGTYPAFEECRNNFSAMQTIDDAGTKDKLMAHDGFVIPWTGTTPQFLPS
jgi:hypothetical protein